eukprot:sb/3478726/
MFHVCQLSHVTLDTRLSERLRAANGQTAQQGKILRGEEFGHAGPEFGNEVTPCQRAGRSPGDLSVRCLRYQDRTCLLVAVNSCQSLFRLFSTALNKLI